jgi:mannosyl-oligosaccharide alpha-1,2-mannosidase
MRASRRTFLHGAGAALALPAAPLRAMAQDVPSPAAVAAEVRDEFLHGWNGYKKAAWGHDEVRPVSGGTHEFFLEDHTFGLSIIEALDTLYVMELDDELQTSVAWLRDHLTFDVDGYVQVFEAIIRMVGGLLAGYAATKERFLLDHARDLADRLMPAFGRSPSGAPYRYVNLHSGAVREPHSNLAEIGSNVLEFGELTRLTGDAKYRAASMRAYRAAIDKRSALDLLGTDFDIERGEWIGDVSVAPNPPVDSFYEYLWGGYALFGEEQLLRWYHTLTAAIMRYQVDRLRGSLWFRNVDFRTGEPRDRIQSELTAFYAGLLGKAGDLATGKAYFDTWTALTAHWPLLPDEFDYATLDATDPRYWLRPEYANSAFDLWRLTRDDSYRVAAYRHFQTMRRVCRVPGGYTVVTDITKTPNVLGDVTPAYWFAENMKYLYLMFANAPRFDDATAYLSTEGKILRGLR